MRLIDADKMADDLQEIVDSPDTMNASVIKTLNIIIRMLRKDYPAIDRNGNCSANGSNIKSMRKYCALYDIKVAIPIVAENADEAEKIASDLKPEVYCHKAIGNCKVDERSYCGLSEQ